MAAFNILDILVLAIFFIFLCGFQDTKAAPPDANSDKREELVLSTFERYPINAPNPAVSFNHALLKNHREIEINDFSSNIPEDAYFYAVDNDKFWNQETGAFINTNIKDVPSLQLSIDMKCDKSIKMVDKKNIKIELGHGYGFDVYTFAILASNTHVFLKMEIGSNHNRWGKCYLGNEDAPTCHCVPANDATKECRKTLDEPCEKALDESRKSPTAGVTSTAGPDTTVTASTTAGTNTAGNTNVTTAKPATTESEQEIPPPPSSAFAIKASFSIILVILGIKTILS